ncbi:MAG: sugar nucleotide-binding protein [Nitrospirae bacterium]|jgi:dTDP-4-dehydrorhamnose reductase|nr:sugar nucleotide-binding protein [Nitrospirota bacterium]
MNPLSLPSTWLFGATSIVGFNLANLFPTTIYPFRSPGKSFSKVRGWPALHLDDPQWIHDLFRGNQPETLIYGHAVCDVPKCEANPNWAYEINVQHVQRTLEAVPSHTRFIYVSSDHVFGGDGTYNESSSPHPISAYGHTRVQAENLVLARHNSLVIRIGLPIGASPNGRTGHFDWLRYRTHHNLPITIIKDEYRSAVQATDLATRIMKLAHSQETGIRHIPATRAISRIELANYLLERLDMAPSYKIESRHEQPVPHLGQVELTTRFSGELGHPLLSVVDH